MKQNSITFSTKKDLNSIVSALKGFAQSNRKTSIERIESTFGDIDSCDIEVVISGVSMWYPWAVQVYVDDLGSSRQVELIAVGNSGFSSAMAGQSGTFIPAIKESIKFQHKLAELLS